MSNIILNTRLLDCIEMNQRSIKALTEAVGTLNETIRYLLDTDQGLKRRVAELEYDGRPLVPTPPDASARRRPDMRARGGTDDPATCTHPGVGPDRKTWGDSLFRCFSCGALPETWVTDDEGELAAGLDDEPQPEPQPSD
jgi:hypothetical protein